MRSMSTSHEFVTLPLPSDEGARLLAQVILRRLGSASSGNFGHAGRPGEIGGSASVTLTSTESRAFTGKQTAASDVSKLTTGALGEKIATAYLGKGTRSLNEKGNNFPIDLIKGNTLVEVKTGLSSNSEKAQQWRATIGQPGPKETAWLAKASDSAKSNWNERKSEMILLRKEQ